MRSAELSGHQTLVTRFMRPREAAASARGTASRWIVQICVINTGL
jgi:hypothetical protein